MPKGQDWNVKALCTLQEGKVLPVRKVTFPSGHKYVGQIGNGTMNGLGVYAFDSSQARYEGEVCIPLSLLNLLRRGENLSQTLCCTPHD